MHAPPARRGGVTAPPQSSSFGWGFALLSLLQSFLVFPEQATIRKPSIVSEPVGSSSLPPTLTSSCGCPWRPSCLAVPAQPGLQGWQLAWFLWAAHLPPAFSFKALRWLLSHHCPVDSLQHPSTHWRCSYYSHFTSKEMKPR